MRPSTPTGRYAGETSTSLYKLPRAEPNAQTTQPADLGQPFDSPTDATGPARVLCRAGEPRISVPQRIRPGAGVRNLEQDLTDWAWIAAIMDLPGRRPSRPGGVPARVAPRATPTRRCCPSTCWPLTPTQADPGGLPRDATGTRGCPPATPRGRIRGSQSPRHS